MENNLENDFNKDNESINIRAEIEKYLVHWKWFLISVFLCVGIAVFYAKTKVNIFETSTTILIKEEGSSSSELMAFQDLTSLGIGGGGNNLVNEIEILKSKYLTNSYVRKLNLNVEIYQRRGLKEVELFENSPIECKVLSNDNSFYNLDTIVDINILDAQKYSYQLENTEETVIGKFGEKINVAGQEILLIPNTNFSNTKNTSYQLAFKNIEDVIDNYRKNLTVVNVDDNSDIISIKLKHPVKQKSELILNTLVDLYNQMSIEDKNLIGKKTDEFITKRLAGIKTELDEIDKLEEQYKSEKQITDISVQSKVFVDAKSENELEVFKKETELRMVEFMLTDIQKQSNDYDLLPSNIGVGDNISLATSVVKYNDLLLERNRLLRSSSSFNPVVKSLNAELQNLRQNIEGSLRNIKKQHEITLTSLNAMEKEFETKISSLPKQAREYRTILRRQSIIAELYSYLLQKKEENEISMAVTVSNAKVIDRAYSSRKPVAPKKPIIALVGLLLGFIIPFTIIYLRDLLDNKFHTSSELKSLVSAPLLGDIPLDSSDEKVVIKQGSRTSTAEAFRLLRTNLDFMLTSVLSNSKTIFVTSTISGEGKTFVSVNTAASLALTGKKVLLMGMDLRAPKITQYLGLPNRNGITNYIVNSENSVLDIIKPLKGFENLDLLSSGIVPPNPAELLLNPKVGEMFEELRKIYDYIVVDTAPVNLVTDTLMLSKYADMFLYVSRANYLDKRLLEVPEKLYQEKRLPNMALLINGIDYRKGYGYGYGEYGYSTDKANKGFFRKIFKK